MLAAASHPRQTRIFFSNAQVSELRQSPRRQSARQGRLHAKMHPRELYRHDALLTRPRTHAHAPIRMRPLQAASSWADTGLYIVTAIGVTVNCRLRVHGRHPPMQGWLHERVAVRQEVGRPAAARHSIRGCVAFDPAVRGLAASRRPFAAPPSTATRDLVHIRCCRPSPHPLLWQASAARTSTCSVRRGVGCTFF